MASEQWARLCADVFCGLRRGAWYRVVFSGTDFVAVDVEGERLLLPRCLLEFVSVRPAVWTVVVHTGDSLSFPPNSGRQYAVCPNCRERQVPIGRPGSLRCRRCNGLFQVAWNKPVVVSGTGAEAQSVAC